jgi:O-antigen/teichoic acid export membrane protein
VLAAQLPIVGVLVLAGGAVLNVYGDAFRQGASWLALLAVAHASNSFAGLVETLLMVERPALNLLNALVTLAVQLVAGLLLIPRFGATGAAAAMCAGFAIQGALRFVELSHVYGWSWPWRSLRRPATAFVLSFVPAAAIRAAAPPGVLVELGIAALFLGGYGLAWRVMGADPADRELWRRLIGTARGQPADTAA